MTILTICLFILILSAISMGAIGDGLYDKNKKYEGKLLKDIEILLLLLLPLIFIKANLWVIDWLKIFLGYIFLRFTLFSPLYNIARGIPINYIGKTGWFDRMLRRFNAPEFGWQTARAVSFILGVFLLLHSMGIYLTITL